MGRVAHLDQVWNKGERGLADSVAPVRQGSDG